MFPAIVRDDLSGADPGARPPRPSHLHIFVTPGAGSSEKKKKKKVEKEGKIDGEMTSCASPSGLRFFNGHKLKLNLYGEEEAEEEEGRGGKQNCQKATILLISFSLCALSKEGERKKGALIIRGVESSNR